MSSKNKKKKSGANKPQSAIKTEGTKSSELSRAEKIAEEEVSVEKNAQEEVKEETQKTSPEKCAKKPSEEEKAREASSEEKSRENAKDVSTETENTAEENRDLSEENEFSADNLESNQAFIEENSSNGEYWMQAGENGEIVTDEEFDDSIGDDFYEESNGGNPKTKPLSKRDKITLIAAAAFVVIALIVGIVLGLTSGGQPSELTGVSFEEIKARVGEGKLVPDFSADGYTAKGTLLFSKKLSYEDMKKRDNDKFITQYEIVYTRSGGGGFVLTATNTDDATVDVSKLTLAEGYSEPVYLTDDTSKSLPIYVQAEKSETDELYLITLCFGFKGQIVGVSARYNNVDDAVKTLKGNIMRIIWNEFGSSDI